MLDNPIVLAWVGIALTLITGWNKILDFVSSLKKSVSEAWKSFPPLIQMAIVIWIIWLLANK